jgi:hypothetical protein
MTVQIGDRVKSQDIFSTPPALVEGEVTELDRTRDTATVVVDPRISWTVPLADIVGVVGRPPVISMQTVCTCGSHKVGSPSHSSWCDIDKEAKPEISGVGLSASDFVINRRQA